jgi:hypothetical protein
LNQGIIPNELFEEKLKNYKYTLIMRCISDNDSLNFRIFYSLLYNMIPLITDDYDPDYLQIPKEFYDQLIVKNSDDIKEIIDYFENNTEAANKLLNELKDYYFKPEYLNSDYYYKLFKDKYFKELY